LIDLPRETALAVKKIKRTEMVVTYLNGVKRVVRHTIEVEIYDPIQPLRMLGLELGLFTETVARGAGNALVEALRRRRARALARTETDER